MIAALYIDPLGPYPALEGVDCWDESRDARKYDGPDPVVAHPPCGPWGRLRHLYKGSEHDCAPRAVEQVRRWGGVLEHPAGSLLWEAARLPNVSTKNDARCRVCGHFELGFARADALYAHCPACGRAPHWLRVPEPTDSFGGYTIELDQVEWGHVARKRTWLYLVGVPREALEAPPFPGREPTHRIGSNTCGRIDGTRYRPDSGLKSASAEQRRRTPPLFAEYIVRLARSVQLGRKVA